METVSVNQCVVPRMYNFAPISTPNTLSAQPQVFNVGASNNMDTVSIRDKKEIYLDKLNKLFPNNSINNVYSAINKDFDIDKPAELKFVTNKDGLTAGGYTFSKNEIDMSLEDLLDNNMKIVGIKDGKRMTLVSPKVKLPLFVDKNSADNFVQMHSQNGNLGFDQLVVEPITEEEQRKFIVQKIAHEVIHAQQHMILRQTSGIGEREVIRAWTHKKPSNVIEDFFLNYSVEKEYNNSYWGNQPETPKTIPANSPAGAVAKTWLEAIRDYPPYDSPEYETNAIEVDAYNRSAEYVSKALGWY